MKGKLLAVGECMMELTSLDDNMFKKSYAGDTYNALVYAKRLNSRLTTSFLTAVGNDQASKDMLKHWCEEDIDDTKTIITDQATIGLYSIATDNKGERSFNYWRAGSAASQMMKYQGIDDFVSLCSSSDIVFFSGISLSVLEDEDKAKLISLMIKLQKQGSKIAFDPNYRPKMWLNNAHARYWLEKAYNVSDILMPGVEEHEQLFGHKNYQEIIEYCQLFGAKEVVIKCDQDGVYGFDGGDIVHHQPFKPAPEQVDSTAAGDSFAGTYLAARLSGDNIDLAIKKSCFVAGEVVQHKGAILTKSVYQQLKTELALLR